MWGMRNGCSGDWRIVLQSFVELKAEIEEFSGTAAILNLQNDDLAAMHKELTSIQAL